MIELYHIYKVKSTNVTHHVIFLLTKSAYRGRMILSKKQSRTPGVKCRRDGELPFGRKHRLRSGLRIPLVHKEVYDLPVLRELQGRYFILKKTSVKKGLHSVKVITSSGLLAAAGVVLAAIAKYIFGEGALRFTIECLPVFIGAFAFGPLVGGAIAVGADLLSCFIAGMAPNPLITVGAFSVGLFAGLSYKLFFTKHLPKVRITLAVFSGHIFGSIILKSLALQIYYQMGPMLFFRIPIYIGISIIESIILCFLFKNKAVKQEIDHAKEL